MKKVLFTFSVVSLAVGAVFGVEGSYLANFDLKWDQTPKAL